MTWLTVRAWAECWMWLARFISIVSMPTIRVSFSIVIGCVLSTASQKERLLTRSFRRSTQFAHSTGKDEAAVIGVRLLTQSAPRMAGPSRAWNSRLRRDYTLPARFRQAQDAEQAKRNHRPLRNARAMLPETRSDSPPERKGVCCYDVHPCHA